MNKSNVIAAPELVVENAMIGAEVVPQPNKADKAAKTLQKLGLKVLHVGNTSISVQGSEAVWRDNFFISFKAVDKSSYRKPIQDPIPVPIGLDELIATVAFAEPPIMF